MDEIDTERESWTQERKTLADEKLQLEKENLDKRNDVAANARQLLHECASYKKTNTELEAEMRVLKTQQRALVGVIKFKDNKLAAQDRELKAALNRCRQVEEIMKGNFSVLSAPMMILR